MCSGLFSFLKVDGSDLHGYHEGGGPGQAIYESGVILVELFGLTDGSVLLLLSLSELFQESHFIRECDRILINYIFINGKFNYSKP